MTAIQLAQYRSYARLLARARGAVDDQVREVARLGLCSSGKWISRHMFPVSLRQGGRAQLKRQACRVPACAVDPSHPDGSRACPARWAGTCRPRGSSWRFGRRRRGADQAEVCSVRLKVLPSKDSWPFVWSVSAAAESFAPLFCLYNFRAKFTLQTQLTPRHESFRGALVSLAGVSP